MALRGEAKKLYQREYMRSYMARKRAAARARVTAELALLFPLAATMPAAEVRRMQRAGLSPEAVQAAGSVFAALQRDRDAIKMHLDAHHETRLDQPDVLTRLERLEEQNARAHVRITLLEAERAAEHVYDGTDYQHAQE